MKQDVYTSPMIQLFDVANFGDHTPDNLNSHEHASTLKA